MDMQREADYGEIRRDTAWPAVAREHVTIFDTDDRMMAWSLSSRFVPTTEASRT
jgi:hypothetical protein